MGTHQGAISHEYLDYYLDEFTFRFNRRNSRHRGKLFYRLLQFVTYYHRERPHESLDGGMIDPWPQDKDGPIVQFERLGGLLKSYRRVKKAA